ncbi:MAG: hypothetical protein ABIO29_07720 [Sphingomicrobium sp.]
MTALRFILTACALAVAAAAAPAIAAPPEALFASDEPIRITIQAPLKQLMSDRAFRGAVAGTLTDPAGAKLPAQFSLRGITRRTAEVCDFAPLRVDFAGPPPTGSVFSGQNKLKLVTHCKTSPGFQQKVLLEYAAYKMYNQLTERSMRARLATVDYIDGDGRPLLSRVGFFLEDVRDIARRNELAPMRAGVRIATNWLSPPDAARYALFQHLIANHDWSMRAGPVGDKCCHNAELIGSGAPGAVIPVPYDFDFSGLVDAPYATAPDDIGISNVRQRRYRGYCVISAPAVASAAEFTQRKPAMLRALAATPGLDPRTRDRAASYLDSAFAQMASGPGLAAILKTCVG